MQEKIKQLQKLYILVENSTATTNFYNNVYKYIGYIKKSKILTSILDQDDLEYMAYDREKLLTCPKQLKKENMFSYVKKESSHMNSNNSSFLNFYFFKITYHIYDLLDWHYKEDFNGEEIECMLHAKKNKFSNLYIKQFPKWKELIKKFHLKLMKELEASTEKRNLFILNSDGSFTYLKKTGKFNIKSKEYEIMNLLYKNKNKVLTYKEIIENIFKKSESISSKRELTDYIKKIKVRLGILPKKKGSPKDIIINHKNHGYSLNLIEEN